MTEDTRNDPIDRFPDRWLDMGRSTYNAPGDTPRDEMWAAIEARIQTERAPDIAPAPRRLGGGLPLLVAAGVALLLGVGLGRWSADPAESARVATEVSDPVAEPGQGAGTAVRLAAARHLNDADALLSFVSADAREGRTDREVGVWGRQLLTQTRLLLDSPVSGDLAMRAVLEDLEMVLAQIAVLGSDGVDAERARNELDLIAAGLQEIGVQSRIQSVLPSMNRGFAADD